MAERKERDRQSYLNKSAALLCRQTWRLCRESCRPKTTMDAKTLKELCGVLKEAAAFSAALEKGSGEAETLKIVFADVPEAYGV